MEEINWVIRKEVALDIDSPVEKNSRLKTAAKQLPANMRSIRSSA